MENENIQLDHDQNASISLLYIVRIVAAITYMHAVTDASCRAIIYRSTKDHKI